MEALFFCKGSECDEKIQVPNDEQEGTLKAAGHSEDDDVTVSKQVDYEARV